MKPWVGIALMHEAEFIAAALPLFEAGEVDVLEWSYDTISHQRYEPAWLPLLLQDYSAKGRLLAHGVRYSLLSGDFSQRQKTWLRKTEEELKRYPYRHITEHFGFMSSGHFHKGAPLPVPLNAGTLAIGHDRLKRLQQASGIPVGVENLAFAFSTDQVKEQGEFLQRLVEPLQGFLILDLHNIWCQAVNFNIAAEDLIDTYPLHLVKEIHVSGGSWSTVSSTKKPIRRDTHDDTLPEEVLRLLVYALPKCPATEAVIFERLGDSLMAGENRLQFIQDFRALRQSVNALYGDQPGPEEIPAPFIPQPPQPQPPHVNLTLNKEQSALISLLTNSSSFPEAMKAIRQETLLVQGGWQTDSWTPEMIETAMQLLKKWN